jgi:PhnB protein
MQVQPYLFFEGRCDEAIAFYRDAVGAEVTMLMRYKDAPVQAMATPENADKVLHAAVRIGETVVLASDGRCSGQPSFDGMALSLTAADDAEAERLFAALSDRFGVRWMVMVGG